MDPAQKLLETREKFHVSIRNKTARKDIFMKRKRIIDLYGEGEETEDLQTIMFNYQDMLKRITHETQIVKGIKDIKTQAVKDKKNNYRNIINFNVPMYLVQTIKNLNKIVTSKYQMMLKKDVFELLTAVSSSIYLTTDMIRQWGILDICQKQYKIQNQKLLKYILTIIGNSILEQNMIKHFPNQLIFYFVKAIDYDDLIRMYVEAEMVWLIRNYIMSYQHLGKFNLQLIDAFFQVAWNALLLFRNYQNSPDIIENSIIIIHGFIGYKRNQVPSYININLITEIILIQPQFHLDKTIIQRCLQIITWLIETQTFEQNFNKIFNECKTMMVLVNYMNQYPTKILKILFEALNFQITKVMIKQVYFCAFKFFEEDFRDFKYQILYKYFENHKQLDERDKQVLISIALNKTRDSNQQKEQLFWTSMFYLGYEGPFPFTLQNSQFTNNQ